MQFSEAKVTDTAACEQVLLISTYDVERVVIIERTDLGIDSQVMQ